MSSTQSFTPQNPPETPTKDKTKSLDTATDNAQPEKPTSEEVGAEEKATLSITATVSTPTKATPSKPAASRKPRCNLKSCNALAQRVVGDCGFCGGKFCGKHRLLESHACSGLEDCKDEARERNKEKLETERTVMVRGV